MHQLPPQPWMTASGARRVIAALEAVRPGSARYVGGCVRNALLGEPVGDIDIATQLTPDVVETAARAAGIAVHPTGIDHGTLTLVADGQPFEVTTLRRDVSTDGRRATVAFTEDWAEDAQRRDFRFNALYAGPDGQVFDPTGGGLSDAAARRVVFVGDPETRLREDYLRILRFFRFNAWYGREIDQAGLAACGALKAGLAGISVERIWAETKKLLGAPDPRDALEAMEESGVMAQLFPEAAGRDLVDKLVVLEAEQGLKPDAMVRMLALFPDGAEAFVELARRLKMSNDERARLVYSSGHGALLAAGMDAPAIRRALYAIGAVAVKDRALLGWAASGDARWSQLILMADGWVRPVFPVTGQDVMAAGLAEGPDVGAAMKRLEAEWIASDFGLAKGELLGRLS